MDAPEASFRYPLMAPTGAAWRRRNESENTTSARKNLRGQRSTFTNFPLLIGSAVKDSGAETCFFGAQSLRRTGARPALVTEATASTATGLEGAREARMSREIKHNPDVHQQYDD